MKQKKCLILANGRPPKKSDLKYFALKGFTELICADGGCNSAFKLGLTPKLIIGDLDSAEHDIIEHFKKLGSKVIQYKRQDDTDVEKCIKYAISKKHTDIILCGATGNRLDHSFCNIGVVLKFSDDVNIYLHHENTIMYCLKGNVTFVSQPGETISVYGIDGKSKFSSVGLKYPLNDVSLKFGEKESTSNESISKVVNLKVKQGKGLIVRELNVIKKNDFLFNN